MAHNCRNNFDCTWCHEYNQYSPINPSVLSPAQEERRKQRKEDKKAKKQTESAKRARRAKSTGKSGEKGLDKLFQQHGYKIKDTVLSGKLKSYSETFGKTDEMRELFEGDKWVEIKEKWRQIESKRRNIKYIEKYYDLAAKEKIIFVKNSFVLIPEKQFFDLLAGIMSETETIQDYGFSLAHNAFKQDGCDIVAISANYKKYIFCLTPEFYQEVASEG